MDVSKRLERNKRMDFLITGGGTTVLLLLVVVVVVVGVLVLYRLEATVPHVFLTGVVALLLWTC